jgi:hypothetical protein
MLAHLPIVILASLHPTLVADTVPKFDVARECWFEGGTRPMQERCAADETQARTQVQSEWKQFTPGAKSQCNQETTADNSPSYVELLTCLEMERDVKDPADAMGAERAQAANTQAANMNRRHSPPGRRNAPPDDRLPRATQ